MATEMGKKKHFIQNPFSNEADYSVLYTTGDIGHVYNGNIIFEGRNDLPVKIHGKRINIAEVESVIQSFAQIDEFSVLCHTFNETSKVTVAYYNTLRKKRETLN